MGNLSTTVTKTLPAEPSITSAKQVHFTGIKGVGMTAAALCVQDLGIPISGSDVGDHFVTEEVLAQRQIKATVGFEPQDIPAETDLLIFTGAHGGQENPQVKAARERGIRVISHAESVGELMLGKTGVSVCGVGGKTSISAMIANILDYSGYDPSFLIGVGKVLNLQVPGRMGKGQQFIAEADEYVVSPGHDNTPRFLYQSPDLIVCSNIVHDHPDVYVTEEDTKLAFQTFIDRLPENGRLILNGDSAIAQGLNLPRERTILYGHKSELNDWWLKETFVGEGKQMVTVANKNREVRFTLKVPGEFNALNALAAYLTAIQLGVTEDEVMPALQLFRGSMRRFEKVGEAGGILYYDDYAHHPTEIEVTLKAAKQWLPFNRIVALFQPHTYSRTRTLMDQFSKSFTHADYVIITDIYASHREVMDETVSGEVLAQEVAKYHPAVKFIPQDRLKEELQNLLVPNDALFTLGAGDIYLLHQELNGGRI